MSSGESGSGGRCDRSCLRVRPRPNGLCIGPGWIPPVVGGLARPGGVVIWAGGDSSEQDALSPVTSCLRGRETGKVRWVWGVVSDGATWIGETPWPGARREGVWGGVVRLAG